MRFSQQSDFDLAERSTRVIRLVLALIFLTFTSVFGFLLYRSSAAKVATELRILREFEKQECTIDRLSVEPSNDPEHPYRAAVVFSGQYNSAHFSADRMCALWTDCSWYSYESAQAATKDFGIGGKHECFVDPQNPAQSVLIRTTSNLVFAGIFALLLIVVGGGAAASLCFGGPRISNPQPMLSKPALSQQLKIFFSIVWLFCALFFLVGIYFFNDAYLLPMRKIEQAKSWRETSCNILHSSVKKNYQSSRKHSGHYVYSADVLYGYEIDGARYEASRLSFVRGVYLAAGGRVIQGGQAQAQAIADFYKVGTSVSCYVNPSNPAEAVLDRTSTPGNAEKIPLVFCLIGALGIFGSSYAAYRMLSKIDAEPEI